MGGQSDLSLSSHQTDDQQYYAKREELQKILPSLEQHLNTLRSRGSTVAQCGLYSVLQDFYRHLTQPIRVPYHVLLTGEELFRREVLGQGHEATTSGFSKGPQEDEGSIWRSTHFRAAIREKLTEAISDQVKTSVVLSPDIIEEQLFAKAKTKDEYLELSARVIVHFKHLTAASGGNGSQSDKPVKCKSESANSLKRKSDESSSNSKCLPSNSTKKSKMA